MARTLLRRLAASAAVEQAVAWVERLDSADPRVLRVLTYHRVDEAEAFTRHLAHLAERYRVVSIARVLTALDGGPPLPPRSVLLTFDDAYRSFAEVAWPALRAHGFAAALFVPTAYPDGDQPRFWWDRLEQAFATSARREPLPTALGLLPLASAAERARAHALLKRHVKDLPHEETLRATGELCAALGVPGGAHEVLGWDELRALGRAGVTLGAHTRTHPRLDRVPRAAARAEILGSLADLEREVPGATRVFAYPDGRFDDELVELLRAAGVELAFTTRRGTNRLGTSDRLRLRRVHVDARDTLQVFRAKLAFSAARLAPAVRWLDPPSAAERRAERANARERRRSQLVLRTLDAALTAGLRPPAGVLANLRRAAAPRSSHYERVGRTVQLALGAAPGLERGLARALLAPARLPLRAPALALAGFGSGTTVFRLEPEPGAAPRALKIYRRTLGRAPHRLAASARRYRQRYRRLCAAFGEVVLPCAFVVLHAPLRGAAAVACVQPWLGGRTRDFLALEEPEIEALFAAEPALAASFEGFSRTVLEWKSLDLFPDLLGSGNLVVVDEPGGLRLRLIDYGVFDPLENPVPPAARAAVQAVIRRLEGLLERMRIHGTLRA